MLDTPPREQPGSRGIPPGDLIPPVLDLAVHARRERLPAPDVIGAGDMLAHARPRPAARRAPGPARIDRQASQPPGRVDAAWRGAIARLRPAANDNRVRIAVLSTILALLVAHVVVDQLLPRFERVIEVSPPTAPGRMISAL